MIKLLIQCLLALDEMPWYIAVGIVLTAMGLALCAVMIIFNIILSVKRGIVEYRRQKDKRTYKMIVKAIRQNREQK